MKRICLILIFIGFMPGTVAALGLGKITLNSGLNQPFDAKIEILSATGAELSTLQVRLADMEAFHRAHIERPFVLSQLNFKVEESEAGSDYIHVYSKNPIREPYLDFLVEADWSQGRLYREYTVLLDPPLYNPYTGKAPATTSARTQTQAPGAPAPAPTTSPSQPPPVTPGGFTGTEYGPVAAGETLWSIASKTRPDASVSVQQMMLALLRTNPEAFINNNINGLKRGQVLRMPNRGEIQSLSQVQAFREVRSQNSMWEEVRASITKSPSVRPVSEGTGTTSTAVTKPGEEQGELRLVTPKGKGAGQTGAETKGSLDKELALVNEQLETVTQENEDLKSRLKDSDGVINDLKRLIQFKDNELAALQKQAATETAGTPEQQAGGEAAPQPETGAKPPAPQEKQEQQPPAPKVVTTPTPAPAGIVGRVKQLIMDNLIPVAGILAAVIVVIILLVFISRRRSTTEEPMAPEVEAVPAGVDEDEVETVFDARHEEQAAAEIEEAESITETPEQEEEQVVEQEAVPEDESEAPTEFAALEEAPEAAAEETATQAAEQPAEFEEEPLAEVNVFLAYEHFDQAEEFVRNAIAGSPENLDYHVKLLEVFYASGNKAGYEEEARVLHDLVDGQGHHWDMAASMWQEMSPNRALFAEPVEGEEAQAQEQAGGMLDLTAAEGEQAEGAEPGGALDFDFGAGEEAPAEDEGVLDISAPSPEEDILDVTAAVSSGSQAEDLLDVTAAVGIDSEPPEEAESEEESRDEIFDLTAGSDEPVLDITSGSDEDALDLTTPGEEAPAAEEDLLDVSKVSGEDLLDVTSHTEFEQEDMDDDLLDVTSSTSAGADSNELLEVGGEESVEATSEDSDALEFDITSEAEPGATDEGNEDNVIEFDTGSETEAGEGLTLGEEPAVEEELSIEEESGTEEPEGLEIDLSAGEQDSDSDALDLSLDEGGEGPGDEIDLTLAEDETGLSLDTGTETEIPEVELEGQDSDVGLELELDSGDEAQEDTGALDMESTVEMPKLELEGEEEGEEDDEEHTVFVPRSSDAQEQTQEDEVATKLDLAKAYVELGDKDSAKGILEEIIADGNPQQQQQAQELLKQI